MRGDTYIAYLRVAMSETEYQDVATIEMEKQSSTAATFQIVGDEALYGKDYILEPEGGVVDISESSSGGSGGKGGPSPYFIVPPPPAVRVTICVGVFRPGFVLFVSPYRFLVRPVWFRPWRPIARSTFRARSAKMHRKSFRRTSHRRSNSAHNMQKKGRKTSKKTTANKSSTAKKNTTSSTAKQNNKSSTTKKNTTSSTAKKSTTSTAKQNNKPTSKPKGGGAKKGGKR